MCVWEDFRVRGSQSLDPWQGAVSPPSPRDGLWIWVPHGGGGRKDIRMLRLCLMGRLYVSGSLMWCVCL